MTELTKDLVYSQLTKQQQLMVSDNTIEEVNKLAEDPEYGAEFLETYMDCMNVLKEMPKRTHAHYVAAVKFFSLVEAGHSLTDAYIKVFPSRFAARGGGDKTKMRGEASRFNNTQMVNEIRRVATVPVHLIHRHLLHEAILAQADLMRNARSEMVRQKAASSLITELKPTEDNTLNVKVDDNTTSVIGELRKATEALAVANRQHIEAGGSLKDVADSKIINAEKVDEDEDGNASYEAD